MVQADAGPQYPEPLPPPPELEARLARWKSQLLDMSGRNRMLFFKDTRQTLRLPISEDAGWERLVEGAGLEVKDASPAEPDGEWEREEPGEQQTLPATPAGAASRARARGADDPQEIVKRLADTNRTFVEEQGVHVLHACFGWLDWVDDSRTPGPRDRIVDLSGGRKGRLVRSPLLLVPVRLDKSGSQQRLVRVEDSPIEPNITLQHYMRQENGIQPEIDEDGELSLDSVVQAWEKVISGRQHWRVGSETVTRVDAFSFKKIALFREMENSEELISGQSVLRALCGDAEPLLERTSVPSYASLDTEVRPDEITVVVPADSSQLRALLAVKHGASIVVQGPPGTGKSQTITNLVAMAIAEGKRVLFVAEKRAARDVVVNNLDKAGLGEVVLHLTEEVSGTRGTASTKRDIADQLGHVLEMGPRTYNGSASAPARVAQLRTELNEYVQHLHTPLGPAPWSTPYLLLARWAACEVDPPPQPRELPRVADVDDIWLEQALDAAAAIDDLGEPRLAKIADSWFDAPAGDWSSGDPATLMEAVGTLRGAAEAAAQIIGDRAMPGFVSLATLSSLSSLAQELRGLAAHQLVASSSMRWARPKYWSARRVEKSWLAAGGGPARGDENSCAQQLDALVRAVVESRTLLRKWIPLFSLSESLSELAEAAVPYNCGIAALEATFTCRTRIEWAPAEVRNALAQLLRERCAESSTREMLDASLKYHWACEGVSSHPSLRVESPSRERLRQRFAEADEALRKHSVSTALNAVAPHRVGIDQVAPKESELGILRGQINAKRRKPLRWLFSKAPSKILELKPCIVSSPLSVAQFLHHPAYRFDLVVFDEASQVPTADAVVPMSRGDQVVIVGDSEQMPPTSFFDKALADDDADDNTASFESVLQECESLLPAVRLLWHYRSRDERLIAFSNYLFYDGTLMTFPASWDDHPECGVRFEYVPDATYGTGGSRSNPREAERVIDLLVQELRAHPDKEIAVTAMSVSQASEVQNRIEKRLMSDPELQRWTDEGNRVKNLETIQGDECDVMFLSFGYGRNHSGAVVANFGPLSRDDGYRRLNVAVTRAREKCVLVSSVRSSDIPPTVGSGGQLVRRYLDYAERGPVALEEDLRARAFDSFDSAFEESVARQLRARGWFVDTQVGVSRFRIDLGIRDPEQPGRYLAGIECDGATYHGAQSARDRDIARQEVLERMGWRIFRIWSPEWFADSGAVLSALDQFLSALSGPERPDGTPNEASTCTADGPGPSSVPAFVERDSRLPPGTVEYLPHQPASPTTRLDRWVARMVSNEGPLHEEDLLTALRDDLGYARMGHLLREEWMNAIVRAESSRAIVRRDLWLWPPDLNPTEVPVRVSLGRAKRDFQRHSDEELWRAMQIACSVAGSLPREGVPAATAKLLGFKLTDQVKSLLSELVPYAVEYRYLKESNGTVTAIG